METITNMNEKTIEGLQELVGVNIDASKGFKHAADAAKNAELASLFSDLAGQRNRFAARLQQYVAWNGEDPKDDGSVRGKLHRTWLDLRAKVTGGDSYALLAECERGEDTIKQKYEDVIVETTGNPVNDVLHEQYKQIKASHDRIRDMRDAAKVSRL